MATCSPRSGGLTCACERGRRSFGASVRCVGHTCSLACHHMSHGKRGWTVLKSKTMVSSDAREFLGWPWPFSFSVELIVTFSAPEGPRTVISEHCPSMPLHSCVSQCELTDEPILSRRRTIFVCHCSAHVRTQEFHHF